MVKRRPRKSIEQWKAVIADQQANGLSRLEYCLKHAKLGWNFQFSAKRWKRSHSGHTHFPQFS